MFRPPSGQLQPEDNNLVVETCSRVTILMLIGKYVPCNIGARGGAGD